MSSAIENWLFAALLITLAVASACAISPRDGVLYQQGRSVVQLEADSSVKTEGPNTQPAKVEPAQLAGILRGIRVRSEQGLIGALLSLTAPAELVFTEDEIELLAPFLSQGLVQARSDQRVAFRYWSPHVVRRNAPLIGSVAVKDRYLKFVLDEHPTIGWQDPEDPSSPKLFELDLPPPRLLRPGTETDRKRKERHAAMLQIDYRAVLEDSPMPKIASPPTARETVEAERPIIDRTAPSRTPSLMPPSMPQAPGNDVLSALQRRIKGLTNDNQELRTKIQELQEQLSETKQLLADKVLELNRLKAKPGRGKSKAKAPKER
jgi:hypothetical protein